MYTSIDGQMLQHQQNIKDLSTFQQNIYCLVTIPRNRQHHKQLNKNDNVQHSLKCRIQTFRSAVRRNKTKYITLTTNKTKCC